MKQRTVDVGEFVALGETLLCTQEFDVPPFQHIQVIEVQLGITSYTVILEHDHRFVGRIGHVLAVQNGVQAGSVIFNAADLVDLPVHDVVAVVIGIEKNGLLLNFNAVFVIISLPLGRNSDIADCVFEYYHKYHLLRIRYYK